MAGHRGRQIYATRRWAALRRAALERAGYRCERCGAAGRLEAHHQEPLAAGGPAYPDPDGVVILCRPCHFKEHKTTAGRMSAAWEAALKRLGV